MSSNRQSLPYRVAKKCEQPGDSPFWQAMNFFFCQAMILYGIQVYKAIKKQFPDKTLIFFPANSGGDAVFYGFFKEYLFAFIGKNENETVLICSQYMKKPFDAVNAANMYLLPMWKICALNMAYHFYGSEKVDLVNTYGIIIGEYGNIRNKDLQARPLNFKVDKEQVTTVLSNANCRPGRTVILSPYENSLTEVQWQIPVRAFWEGLANALKAAGFDVCTNCLGDSKEPVIKGTSRVFPRLNECEELVDQAGATVILRSGFADWVSFSRGTMVTLYPSERAWTCFRLWNTKDFKNHHEIIYEGDVSDEKYRQELISQIVEMVKDAKTD